MEFAEILKNYQELKKLLEDTSNYICFGTKNGRRMIVRIMNSRECIPVDYRFRVTSFEDENNNTFYESPLRLLESYFTDGNVIIDDILITKDKTEALSYLQEILTRD